MQHSVGGRASAYSAACIWRACSLGIHSSAQPQVQPCTSIDLQKACGGMASRYRTSFARRGCRCDAQAKAWRSNRPVRTRKFQPAPVDPDSLVEPQISTGADALKAVGSATTHTPYLPSCPAYWPVPTAESVLNACLSPSSSDQASTAQYKYSTETTPVESQLITQETIGQLEQALPFTASPDEASLEHLHKHGGYFHVARRKHAGEIESQPVAAHAYKAPPPPRSAHPPAFGYRYAVRADGQVMNMERAKKKEPQKFQRRMQGSLGPADDAGGDGDDGDKMATKSEAAVSRPSIRNSMLAGGDIGRLGMPRSDVELPQSETLSAGGSAGVDHMLRGAPTLRGAPPGNRGIFLEAETNESDMINFEGLSDISSLITPAPVEGTAQGPKLRIFTYCIGPRELFGALWDLGLSDRVEWVDKVSSSDVVIHRHPQPGEKQFHYLQFREDARQLGIPFFSIWTPTASELADQLLSVMQLYSGDASPADVVTFKRRSVKQKGKIGGGRQKKKIWL